MDNYDWILKKLPYTAPFCFVDSLEEVAQNRVVGHYRFPGDSFFYKGHFKDLPVTPGVILAECCAQIGLVCMGIYLLSHEKNGNLTNSMQIAMSSNEMEYYVPVCPEEKVRVESTKVYFRFNKLKCKVKMFNSENQLVCSGVVAGMFKSTA